MAGDSPRHLGAPRRRRLAPVVGGPGSRRRQPRSSGPLRVRPTVPLISAWAPCQAVSARVIITAAGVTVRSAPIPISFAAPMETAGALTFTEAVGSVSAPAMRASRCAAPVTAAGSSESGRPPEKHLRVGDGATEVGDGAIELALEPAAFANPYATGQLGTGGGELLPLRARSFLRGRGPRGARRVAWSAPSGVSGRESGWRSLYRTPRRSRSPATPRRVTRSLGYPRRRGGSARA